MPFEKGKSGNPNGKPPGAKGQKTLQWEASCSVGCDQLAQLFS